MNKKLAIALLSVGLLSANAARADDALLGALLGGGAGVLIGHSVGGRNGAVIGGALGAAAGIAVASERQQPRVAYYMPPPVYVSQPVYMAPVVMETVPVRYERERWAHRHWQHYRD
jgi:hypothetical protein